MTTNVPVIDADTHIDETEATWEYMVGEEASLRPYYAQSENRDPATSTGGHYWMVDGKRQRRRVRSDEATRTTRDSRELLDVDVRLRHMDELGVDVHVIYPTLFITEFTDKPEVEFALRRSYNQWLGDRTGQSREARERLRWVMLPPVQSMDKVIDEMRRAKENGACGILKKGDREAGYWPAEEYFFPMYEEAERLDMAVCFHTGGGVPDFTPARRFPHVNFMQTKAPIQNAFLSLIAFSVPALFPKLRFAFVENGASWVPHIVYTLKRNKERLTAAGGGIQGPDYALGANLLQENNFYVTCQVDEDLPYILRYAGEDNLMVGSDYSHSDPSQEGRFPDIIQGWADRGEIGGTAARKILYDNPKACYGM
ncbi:MAG: putative metal-dependent hydrolase, TIM-barrel fold [Chloroflexi bacterium]|jgi:predicted TIM-barrel fold metal-dependent hydrolase|nr:MAG: putative metal-dependent hydrolase, TIM-barrel fold [Chloroflexota bacterium]